MTPKQSSQQSNHQNAPMIAAVRDILQIPHPMSANAPASIISSIGSSIGVPFPPQGKDRETDRYRTTPRTVSSSANRALHPVAPRTAALALSGLGIWGQYQAIMRSVCRIILSVAFERRSNEADWPIVLWWRHWPPSSHRGFEHPIHKPF